MSHPRTWPFAVVPPDNAATPGRHAEGFYKWTAKDEAVGKLREVLQALLTTPLPEEVREAYCTAAENLGFTAYMQPTPAFHAMIRKMLETE